jgi:hypothetical protein
MSVWTMFDLTTKVTQFTADSLCLDIRQDGNLR